MSKRRTHSPEFKARVAMEAISGRKTIQEIAADHAIHPIQVSQWKKQLLDGASELLTRGKKSKDREEGQAKEVDGEWHLIAATHNLLKLFRYRRSQQQALLSACG